MVTRCRPTQSSRVRRISFCASVLAASIAASPANATLTTYQSFTGTDGLSSDGCGTLGATCPLVINVPTGSTILSATLYTSIQRGPAPVSGTLASGTQSIPITYTFLQQNASSSYGLLAGRADVTSFVSSVVGSGQATPINFNVTETDTYHQDGEALFVIYSNPTLPTQTVALVDGAAASTGDMTTINFAQPISKSAPGFAAELRVADGFSFDLNGNTSQTSTITVNGSVLSNNVGNCDDGLKISGTCADGNLITVGSDNDPLQAPDTSPSGNASSIANTHERFDISSLLTDGSSAINVNTVNASLDDNIFALAFLVSGTAGVNAPPPTTGVQEPASLATLAAALAMVGLARRRQSQRELPL